MTVESAIPPHLTVERTRPRRVPDGYAPPYPSYVARNAQSVDKVVMAYLGLQPVGDPRTNAEMSAAEKNSISHRGRAFAKLVEACFR